MNLSQVPVVSIVVAKEHSSRVPHKNFRPFYQDKSLVDLVLSLHCRSELDLPLILSTDHSAYFPSFPAIIHARRDELARVETPVLAVLLDIIKTFSLAPTTKLILLQPTSPFRSPSQYCEFLSLLNQAPSMSTLFSVYKVEDNHPARMYSFADNNLVPYLADQAECQSQELDPCFHRNGCFYGFNVSDIISGRLYGSSLFPYIMPFESSVNIDTPLDFKLAQALYPEFLSGTLADLS